MHMNPENAIAIRYILQLLFNWSLCTPQLALKKIQLEPI